MKVKKIILMIVAVAIALFISATAAQAETFKLTAYCSCSKCCGKWAKYNKTASDTTPVAGRTVAVDKSVIPLGTPLLIDGHEYIAEDTGVKGNTIDIYFNSHQEALKFGVQYKDVQIGVEDNMGNELDMKWISCKEKLSPPFIDVLVTVEIRDSNGIPYDSYVGFGWQSDGMWHVGDNDGVYVTAWMELPPPYIEVPAND